MPQRLLAYIILLQIRLYSNSLIGIFLMLSLTRHPAIDGCCWYSVHIIIIRWLAHSFRKHTCSIWVIAFACVDLSKKWKNSIWLSSQVLKGILWNDHHMRSSFLFLFSQSNTFVVDDLNVFIKKDLISVHHLVIKTTINGRKTSCRNRKGRIWIFHECPVISKKSRPPSSSWRTFPNSSNFCFAYFQLFSFCIN